MIQRTWWGIKKSFFSYWNYIDIANLCRFLYWDCQR